MHWSHQPPLPEPVVVVVVGGAQQRTVGVLGSIATAKSSGPQLAQAQPHLRQPAQQPKAPTLQEGNGGESLVTLVEGGPPPRAVLEPSVELPPRPSCHPARTESLATAKSSDTSASQGSSPRPSVSRMEGGGGGVGWSHWGGCGDNGGCFLQFEVWQRR